MKIEERYHEPILRFIEEKGESGVNAIASGIDLPLSSVHKYLERQDYFKKTVNKKWDLPEKVNEGLVKKIDSNRLALMVAQLETQSLLFSDQFDSMNALVSELVNQIGRIGPLLENHKPPVAKTENIDPRIAKLQEEVKLMTAIIRKNEEKFPEEYQSILGSTDWLELTLGMGRAYLTKTIADEIAALIMGETDILSDDVLDTLNRYQK